MGRYLELANEALKQPCGESSRQFAGITVSPTLETRKLLDSEERFCQPHAKLFRFLGRKIRTPAGPGALLQVFANRVTVLLDCELSRCTWFRPEEVEPASPE